MSSKSRPRGLCACGLWARSRRKWRRLGYPVHRPNRRIVVHVLRFWSAKPHPLVLTANAVPADMELTCSDLAFSVASACVFRKRFLSRSSRAARPLGSMHGQGREEDL